MADNPITDSTGLGLTTVPTPQTVIKATETIGKAAETIYNQLIDFLGDKTPEFIQQITDKEFGAQKPLNEPQTSFEINSLSESSSYEDKLKAYNETVETKTNDQTRYIDSLEQTNSKLQNTISQLTSQIEALKQNKTDTTEIESAKKIDELQSEIINLQNLSGQVAEQQNFAQQKLNGLTSLIEQINNNPSDSINDLQKILENFKPSTLESLPEELKQQLTPYIPQQQPASELQKILIGGETPYAAAKQLNVYTGEIEEVPRAQPVFKSNNEQQVNASKINTVDSTISPSTTKPQGPTPIELEITKLQTKIDELQKTITDSETSLKDSNINTEQKITLKEQITKSQSEIDLLTEQQNEYQKLFNEIKQLIPKENKENKTDKRTDLTDKKQNKSFKPVAEEKITESDKPSTLVPVAEDEIAMPPQLPYYWHTDPKTLEMILKDEKGQIVARGEEEGEKFLQSIKSNKDSLPEPGSSPENIQNSNEQIIEEKPKETIQDKIKTIQTTLEQQQKIVEIGVQGQNFIENNDLSNFADLKTQLMEALGVQTQEDLNLAIDKLPEETRMLGGLPLFKTSTQTSKPTNLNPLQINPSNNLQQPPEQNIINEIKDYFKTLNTSNINQTNPYSKIDTTSSDNTKEEINANSFINLQTQSDLENTTTAVKDFANINDLSPTILQNTNTIIAALLKIAEGIAMNNNAAVSNTNITPSPAAPSQQIPVPITPSGTQSGDTPLGIARAPGFRAQALNSIYNI